VSRRALLEEEQRAAAAEIRKSIEEGAVVTGRVVSALPFGAFVDLGGGVQGLLHVSEIGWSHISDASNVVKVGDEITVKVLRVDHEKQKISLGLKQLLGDPWSTAAQKYQAGQMRSGRVTRVAPFGVFVELEPGIEGLIPAAEIELAKDADFKKAFPPETIVEVVLLEVDASGRRMRLSSKALAHVREAEEVREYGAQSGDAPQNSLGSLADKLRSALSRLE
jgi:ribosomal protein S1